MIIQIPSNSKYRHCYGNCKNYFIKIKKRNLYTKKKKMSCQGPQWQLVDLTLIIFLYRL